MAWAIHNRTLGLRSLLLLGIAAGTLPCAADEQSDVELVVVTGSRIPQGGFDSASPVISVGRQEMLFEGTTDVSTLINNLPVAFADQGSTASNDATGTANVDLRGLGPTRTLVLINGTRLMPADVFSPVADLNQIPAALVDHVEVLTGGASAVYGSDALAGVVNFIMRKDFEGIELDATYAIDNADNENSADRARLAEAGFAQAPKGVWDGASNDATLILGTTTDNGRGNVSAYVGRRNMAPVLEATRDFSACSLSTTFAQFNARQPLSTGLVCQGSSNYNQFFSVDNLLNGEPYDFFETGTGARGSGAFEPYTGGPGQTYNYGAFNYLQRADTRYVGGFFAHYQNSKRLDVYSSLMFSDDDTVAQIAPSGLFFGIGEVDGSFAAVNCSNPLMTPSERVTLCGADGSGAANLTPGQATLLIGRRDIEGGDRQTDLRHTAWRMQVGMRGDLDERWSYDVYGQYGLTLFSEGLTNEFSISRVQNALEVDPATGACYAAEPNASGLITAPDCVPLDIFNGFGSISRAALNYVTATGYQQGQSQEQIVGGALTGDLGAWGGKSPWAGSAVAVSTGAEWRSETLALQTSRDYQTNDLYSNSAVPPVPAASIAATEGFIEFKAPLADHLPWIEQLAVDAGYRYSSYNTAGRTQTYKLGAEWQWTGDIRFRASDERAVRAPNVLELFTPTNSGLFGHDDPCSTSVSGRCANVVNAGSPLLDCPNADCTAEVGGNVRLQPETAVTRTLGVVLTPQAVAGLTATIDYFDIDIAKFIGQVDPGLTLAECYGAHSTLAAIGFFCPLVHRNSQGQLFGGGFVDAQNTNTGFLATRGIDLDADYVRGMDSLGGSLDIDLLGTYVVARVTEPVAGEGFVGTYDCAGLYGAVCDTPTPRWRHKLRVTWTSQESWALSFGWRHLGPVWLDENRSNPLLNGFCGGPCNDVPDARISSYDYFDVTADWTVREGVDLRAGINNLLARDPPVMDSNVMAVSGAPLGNGNTYPGVYDSLGRNIFVSATIKY
ncbi:MAG TPA: TonB-dependent receptor [Rhizomicrobium sp.]|jgi:outer membrane receptor protein involved in Fe transport